MAEDGWDRLAATFSGFHGGVLFMSRQFEWPNSKWGEGNWSCTLSPAACSATRC